MRLVPVVLAHTRFTLPRCRTTFASTSPADWWEAEAQAYLSEQRDWDAVCSAMHAAISSEDAPLPGDEALPPPPGPLPPWTTPSERAPAKCKSRRETWAATVAYFGPAFASFTWRPEAPSSTVIGCVQQAITPLLQGKSSPVVSSAGRTDAGVSAVGQLLTFHSWAPLTPALIGEALHAAAPPGSLRVRAAARVDRSFHATFSARYRRYTYLLPSRADDEAEGVSAERLQALLAPLVGPPRDYAALGRGVPAGKDTTMSLLRCDASRVALPDGGAALRFDVVGDRFVRRQVRCLVATAVHAARTSAADDALLRLATGGDRRQTAPAAPPEGLCLAQVGYGEYGGPE